MSTHPDPTAPTRGRPPTITPERLADIGIRLGLPNLTMANVAAELAVTQAALYKRVANLEALKRLVAETVFQRWQIPLASVDAPGGLEAYLMGFVESLCEVVKAHPGLPPYLLRRTVATASMLEKIASHQAHVADVFGLPVDKARWLLATIAFYCIAGADTIYAIADDEEGQVITEFKLGMRALVIGSLQLVEADGALQGRAMIDGSSR
ncbi:TetR/AcrR family transcriptional regulator [Stenotrophomonas maltophilia]|uniref:TetR/AcrR family transcriptional regulator n=1 Tax=Stenotrophomonas maltophilia TaxID=40324 RepID=UPI0012AF899C|nr:TetR/AcrR family transcriptional regulator [Stenotrophomonas maltophilia]ELC7363262.1 TetR/AcrR family transcriptional regulator [Stenotrophomonas maltophilia]MBA0250118.1 TetR/AcrR family transcriptional regulator [Stenotrophomonas maltophilia]MBA0318812.1 TetR/AcrR family transcriptional regulator [Stenotrophomonas maltophilia]MBH1630846.1 TetR/AcrR family transcriptional regulator [Stenotrophomonas maltophilia]MCU1141916.1 TetR/AcrR family transcriptional regulator [Stenotrophomonas malt